MRQRILNTTCSILMATGVVLNFASCSKLEPTQSNLSSFTEPIPEPIKKVRNAIKTSVVARSSRALDTLVSCLGTKIPSSAANEAWASNKGTLSVDGDSASITPPMMKALGDIASEVCLDLIRSETNLPASQRRIFDLIDFTSVAGSVTGNAVSTVTNRLVRSCWGRNESAEEMQMINSAIDSAFQGADNSVANTTNKMIFLCSAVASSIATFEM